MTQYVTNVCIPFTCHSDCLTCSGPNANQCLTCGPGRYPDNTSCPSCPVNCATCQSAAFCLSCQGTNNFHQNTCLVNCPDRTYSGSSNGVKTCLACNFPCENCFGPNQNQCSSCPGTKNLYQNTCLDICPDGTYSDVQNNLRVCLPCDSRCQKCDGPTSTTNCLSCSPTRIPLTYLDGKSCLEQCPRLKYKNLDQ